MTLYDKQPEITITFSYLQLIENNNDHLYAFIMCLYRYETDVYMIKPCRHTITSAKLHSYLSLASLHINSPSQILRFDSMPTLVTYTIMSTRIWFKCFM